MPDDLTVVEFTVGAGHTVNLGNYNNISIRSELKIAVKEGADFAALRAQAQEVLRNMLEETYKAQRRKAPEATQQ